MPEDKVDRVQKIVETNTSGEGYLDKRAKKIQVIGLETLKAMRHFYMQAEKSLGVYMPAILVRHKDSTKGSYPCHFSAEIS